MRVNVYSQELTDEVLEITKESNTGIVYHAAQLVLLSSFALHHPPEDDDRSAVTFWLPTSLERRESMAIAFEKIAAIFRGSSSSLASTLQGQENLIDTAVLMAQELQEFVDDAIETSGDFNSLEATQKLLKDWVNAFGICGFGADDRFAGLRRSIAAEEGFCNYQVGHEIEVEHGEFREYISDGAENPA
jgi:hypothetical protein